MIEKVKGIVKRPFARNVMIVASGTSAAQAISMLLSPVITRLYGPEAYGVMGVFMAIVGVIVPIAALTYPIAIVLPKSDQEAKGIFRLSLYISTGIATITILFLFLFNKPIVQLLQIGEVAPYLYLIPLVILLSGFLQVLEQWLIRKKQFRVTAKATALQALILNASKVGIGFFHPVAAVLVILSAMGNGLKAIMLAFFIKESSHKESIKIQEDYVSIKGLAIKYYDFPLFRAPEALLNTVSQSLPILMLSSFFGPASAGFYSIGRSVLNMPTNLIGKSVGDVFYPRISEAANKGEDLTALIKKATLSLLAVGIIPFGSIVIFGPWLFSYVFGAEWVVAGEYARWVALSSLFGFIIQPSVRSMPVLSAQAFYLKYTIFLLAFRAISLAVGYYVFSSDLIAVAMFGVTGSILNICLVIITIRISRDFVTKSQPL